MSTPATDPVQQSLYEQSQKIYPRQVHGTFAVLRVVTVFFLLGLFYILPWVPYDGHQSVLFDLPARKFYVFGLTFWPQDFLLLTLLMMMAALTLFFFTTIAGRLWCGYACPQTVWTEVFLWMERMIEGDRPKRMKLDAAPWSARKLRIKATKQLAWISFAAVTGFTFVSFFTPALSLSEKLMNLSLGPWETFWMVFYAFATYGNAGYMREQVCKYMCPYARFQSAMFDKDTLIVSYDTERGEPRGSRRSGTDLNSAGLGSCIDCTLCVQVCPTGIDIRDGLQYECIGCSSCIDVCNTVMDRMGYERGLIRYTTEHALENKPSRIVRPRTLIYGGLLALVGTIFLTILVNRDPMALDIIRDRNQLYRERGGFIENVYTLKIINLADSAHEFRLNVNGIANAELSGLDGSLNVAAGHVSELPVVVRAREADLTAQSIAISFDLTRSSGENPLTISETARFLGPIP